MANGVFGGGNGTLKSPYLIEDGFDLDAVRNNLIGNYKIVKNLDLTEVCSQQGGNGWKPIAEFRGVLDGNGFSARNLFINRSENDQALFSSLRGGAITNLGLTSINVVGGTQNAAAFVGQMTTQDDLIENCFATGNISAASNAAGLVGTVNGGNILNCYSEVDITTTGTGCAGITTIVNNTYSTIKNCFYAGTITGGSAHGGCVATIKAGTVKDCFYDSTKNWFNTKDGLATAVMQTAEAFSAWKDQYYNFERPVWVLRDGSYPRLFYTEATKYFIFTNNVYKTYKNNAWVDISNKFPTESEFAQHGITDNTLAEIPRFKWNELRQFNSFELVASTDKFIVERNAVEQDMIVDSQIADAVILKTTIDFSKFGDSINKIRVVQ